MRFSATHLDQFPHDVARVLARLFSPAEAAMLRADAVPKGAARRINHFDNTT